MPALARSMAVQAGEASASPDGNPRYCEPCLNHHHQLLINGKG
ncbi:hypothetical protein [Xenorhabdus doucetiae]|nr:hypothetical protein [Xenorhabdus doucetiae]